MLTYYHYNNEFSVLNGFGSSWVQSYLGLILLSLSLPLPNKLLRLQPWYAHGIAEAILRTADLSVPLKVRSFFILIMENL